MAHNDRAHWCIAAGARLATASRVTDAQRGRWSDLSDDLAMGFTALAYPVNCDLSPLIIYQIDDTIDSLPDPVTIVVASELLGARWPRIIY
jgi:hypothetical protein